MKITTVSEIPQTFKRSKYDDDIDDIMQGLRNCPDRIYKLSDAGIGLLTRLRVRRKKEGVNLRIRRINSEVYVTMKAKDKAPSALHRELSKVKEAQPL